MINPLPQAASTVLLPIAALVLIGSAGQPLPAQSTPTFNRNVIVLDPAHGGGDTGARIADNLPEKQVTLAFAAQLRQLLTATGFTVIATRDADPPDTAPTYSTDQRAGIANHVRAAACLLLHATPSGSGVHLFTSTLPAPDLNADPNAIIPWDSAQSPYIPLSLRLANQLGLSLLHANISPLLGHASIRPLDNLTCPAVALELAPLVNPGSDPTPLSDPAYQQRIAKAIVDALVAWRTQATPPPPPSPKPAPDPTSPGAPH